MSKELEFTLNCVIYEGRCRVDGSIRRFPFRTPVTQEEITQLLEGTPVLYCSDHHFDPEAKISDTYDIDLKRPVAVGINGVPYERRGKSHLDEVIERLSKNSGT